MKTAFRCAALAAMIGGLALAPAHANTISYAISDGGLVGGFGVQVDGHQESNALVGGIKAQNPSGSLTSVCLDLLGTLRLGQTYQFTVVDGAGQLGQDPAWGLGSGAAAMALNNAGYIFAEHGNVTDPTDWAATQLAVWKALYDTRADGSIDWGPDARFLVTTDPTGSAWNLAQSWLNGADGSHPFDGELLKPLNPDAQELFLTARVPDGGTGWCTAAVLLPLAWNAVRQRRRGGATPKASK